MDCIYIYIYVRLSRKRETWRGKSGDYFSLQFPRDGFKYRRVPAVPSRALSFRPEKHGSWLYFRGNDQSVNITRVGITENGDGSYRLTGLRKYTQYSIVVKAFNNKGDGPGSDPVTVQTLEDGERTTSRLFLLSFVFLSFFFFENFLNDLLVVKLIAIKLQV